MLVRQDMLYCAVCNDYTIGRLCGECTVLRHAMTLYGKEHVLDTVTKVFKRNTQGITRVEGKILSEVAKEAQAKVDDA